MRITAVVPTHHLAEESMPWMAEARGVFDELVVLIDEKRVTDGTMARAEEVGTRVVLNKGETWYDPDRFSMLATCDSDWIFALEYDEQLSPEWQQQDTWRQILETTQFTHFWIPRRWVVPNGHYIDCNPWWPDFFQLRLLRNNIEGTIFPTKLHDVMHVPGKGASFRNLAIHHHVLWLLSREQREAKAAYYERLRPGFGAGHYYLYEDYWPSDAPVPTPVKLDINNEVCWMDKLQREDVPRLSFKINRVPQAVRTLEFFWLDVAVTNLMSQSIYSYPLFPVRLAYHWIEKATRRMVVFEGERSGLFPGVHAGADLQCAMMIMAPSQPGEYILQTTMVQEGVCWFENVRPDILQEFTVRVTPSY